MKLSSTMESFPLHYSSTNDHESSYVNFIMDDIRLEDEVVDEDKNGKSFNKTQVDEVKRVFLID